MSFHATLDSFLQAASSGNLDSSGDFQVNVKVAREKLRVFQEELSVFALLRLIQGLVACGAKKVEVKLHRDRVELESDVRVPMEELQASYRSRAGLSESGLGMIAAGVNASLCEPEVPVWLTTDDRKWDPRAEQTETYLRSGFHFVQRFRGGSFSLRNLFRRTKLFKELQRRCRYCPCEFVLDGRKLEAHRPSYSGPIENSFVSAGTPELEHLVPGVGFRYRLPELKQYRWTEEFYLWNSKDKSPRSQAEEKFFPSKGYTGLPSGFEHRDPECRTVCIIYDPGDQQWCKIHFLRYGVLSETHKHPDLPANTVVLVDATDLATDLSGLKIVCDHRFDVLVRSVMKVMLHAVKLLLVHHAEAEEAYFASTLNSAPWRRLMTSEGADPKSVSRRMEIWSTWVETAREKLTSEEPLSDSLRW